MSSSSSTPRPPVTGPPAGPVAGGRAPAPSNPARHGPVVLGFLYALGALTAFWLGGLLLSVGGILILVVVALFIAVGLDPAVRFFEHRGLRRPWAVLLVITFVVIALVLFFVALVPVITEQVSALVKNVPQYVKDIEHNRLVQKLDQEYGILQKVQDFVTSGKWTSSLFGGVVGVAGAVFSFFANAFIVTVLALYFLASLETVKGAIYDLAPASRRPRTRELGEQILRNVGGYVSGAFIVAMCAGISSLIFLLIAGLAEYAVALAAVVALLDVIPMIGATLGAIIVCAIGFATDVKIGIACVIFYVLYQQFENYVIYPRVMSRSVNVPGSITVIAALIGAGLLGVVGALLAIPTAAAILLLVKELWVPRQDAR